MIFVDNTPKVHIEFDLGDERAVMPFDVFKRKCYSIYMKEYYYKWLQQGKHFIDKQLFPEVEKYSCDDRDMAYAMSIIAQTKQQKKC